MKIPGTPNGVKSTAIPTPYANTDTRGAFGASFASTIDKVDNAVDSVQAAKARQDAADAAEAAKARAAAKAISKAQADADYNRAETEIVVGGSNRRSLIDQAFDNPDADPTADDVQATPGFLSTRGQEAYAKSGEAIEAARKRAEAIAKARFADPADREEWLAHNLSALTNTERRIEQHAAQQFEVARKDALEGIRATALDAVAYAQDAGQAAHYTRNAEARIRELATTEEGAHADVMKFRQDAIGVRIAKMLSEGDVAGAEAQFAATDQLLGAQAPKWKHAIDAAKKTQETQAFDVEAQKAVDSIVESGTKPNGQPDLQVMDALIEKLPPGKLRDEAEQRLTHAKVKATRRWEARISREVDGVLKTYIEAGTLGAVDPKAKSWLIENAPEEWVKLKARERSDSEYWRRLREGKPPETTDSARALVGAKADIDERADYYRSLSEEDFFRQPIVQGLTPAGLKEIGNYWVGMRKRDPIPDGQFNQEVSARIGQSEKLSKDKEAARQFRARANQERLDFLARNNNKEPDYAQRDGIFDRTTADIAVPGRFYGTNTKPAYAVPSTGPSAGPLLGPPANAKPTPGKKLAPGRYTDKSGKVWVVDAAGNKRAE